MCGIAVLLLRGGPCACSASSDDIDGCNSHLQEALRSQLHRRGPNTSKEIMLSIAPLNIWLHGSVLHIQGESATTAQPYRDEPTGSALLWNGEVFGPTDTSVSHRLLPDYTPGISCDTPAVCALLIRVTEVANGSPALLAGRVVEALSVIEGPYAFIFYHAPSGLLFFGRDPFGRRSLLLGLRDGCLQCISSTSAVADDRYGAMIGLSASWCSSCNSSLKWKEVDVRGIYVFDTHTTSDECFLAPWPTKRLRLGRDIENIAATAAREDSPSATFLNYLRSAVQSRVRRLRHHPASPRIGVLFSGGIDSLLLSAMLHQSIEDDTEPIELINVTFLRRSSSIKSVEAADCSPEEASPDRLASIVALGALKSLFPLRPWRLVHVDVLSDERLAYEQHVQRLISPCDTHMDLNIGTALWFAARGSGYICDYKTEQINAIVSNQVAGSRGICGESTQSRPLLRVGAAGHAASVGSDSNRALLRRQEQSASNCSTIGCGRISKVGCIRAHCKKCCDSAHREQLLNKLYDIAEGGAVGSAVLEALQGEVLNKCPVHYTKKKDEQRVRQNIQNQLQHHLSIGSSTGLDEIISQTTTRTPNHANEMTNFSSTEEAGLFHRPEQRPYECQCSALLVGIGADEQLAGYGRHRTVFNRSSAAHTESQFQPWRDLAQEMNVDLSRLWTRNLGRDDRCISDHGREAWFPFLDEQVVAFLQSLPLNEIADLHQPPGVGDKQILRQAAASLGLPSHCTQLVKRAIQFGTRVAQHMNEQHHHSNRKGKGDMKLSDIAAAIVIPPDSLQHKESDQETKS